MLRVWWPFAPKPERADTSEVTDLHSGAPPLYSTLFVVRTYFLIEHGNLGTVARKIYANRANLEI